MFGFLRYVGFLKSQKVTCWDFLWYVGISKFRKVTCWDFLWCVGFLKSQKVTFGDFENLEIATSGLLGVWRLEFVKKYPNWRQMGPGRRPNEPNGPRT